MEATETRIGVLDAQTHLSRLLDRVAKGESITITRHGKPVARLVPVSHEKTPETIRETIEALKAFRRGRRLDGASLRDMIEEGRR